MNDNQGDHQALIRALDRFNDRTEQLLSLNSGNTTSSISINAGGVGIWICASLCGMMLVGLMVGGIWMNREFSRYDIAMSERKEEGDRAQTYLSSIFGRMPQWMREEVEKEVQTKQELKGKKDAE